MGYVLSKTIIFGASVGMECRVSSSPGDKNTWEHIKEPGYREYSRNRHFFISELWGFVPATLNSETDKELFYKYMEIKNEKTKLSE